MRTLFIGLLCSVCFCTQAQIKRGTWTLGGAGSGGLGVGSGGVSTLSARISPSAGYFPVKNLMVGSGFSTGFSYSDLRNNGSSSGIFRSSDISMQLFSRYYFAMGKGTVSNADGSRRRLMLYPEIGIGYGFSRSNYSFNETGLQRSNITQNQPKATVGFGASYWLTENFAIEATLKTDVLDLARCGNSMIPFSIPIGFRYYFGRGK